MSVNQALTFVSIEEDDGYYLITVDIKEKHCCRETTKPAVRTKFYGVDSVWHHYPSGIKPTQRIIRTLQEMWIKETEKGK